MQKVKCGTMFLYIKRSQDNIKNSNRDINSIIFSYNNFSVFES